MRLLKMCLLLVTALLTTSSVARADFFSQDQCCDWDCGPCKPYVRLGTGLSYFTRDKHRRFDDPVLISSFGSRRFHDRSRGRPIFGVGLGYDFGCLFSADLTLQYRPGFGFRRAGLFFPTGSGFSESVVRRFNLDVTSLMFTGYLNGGAWDILRWDVGCNGGYIQPVFGFGFGASELRVRNSRVVRFSDSVFLADASQVSGDLFISYRFTYSLSLGIEYKACDWAVSTGFRWFGISKFRDSDRRERASDFAFANDRFFGRRNKAHASEWFLDFKLYF